MQINQFSQIGKRSNNEDSLGTSKGLITVCDGMGGHNFGERASAFVKEAMLKAFAEPQQLNKLEIQQHLNQVQQDLNQLLVKEPELEKMGTTFTGVFITPDVWYAAHIGDSRIYLFRPSEQKLWHTWDHSLVGELMRTKEITVEAGRFHPMSNRISKAIIAQKEGKIANASVVKIDELKKGDIFLLCSDGVVEAWGDWELVQLFSDESLSFEQKCQKLAQQCNAKSKDNNTAIIAEIGEEDAFSYGTNDELEWTSFDAVKADYDQYVKDNEEVKETASKLETPNSETPTPMEPKTSETQQNKEQVPAQEASQPSEPKLQQATSPKQVTKPTIQPAKAEKKHLKKLIPLLVVLLIIVVVAMLLKGRKPKDDDSAFAKCKDVKDYREYVSDFGKEAKHYKEAVQFIDKYVSDSTIKANAKAEKETKKAENEMFRKCKTIEDCDLYLKTYPDGRYVDEVKKKKAELEAKANVQPVQETKEEKDDSSNTNEETLNTEQL